MMKEIFGNNRPTIEDDKEMIEIASDLINAILGQFTDEIETSKYVTYSYLYLVMSARIRTGSADYEFLQDIAETQLAELIGKIYQKKEND
jgi:methionine synthase II (cobalamin-independent)